MSLYLILVPQIWLRFVSMAKHQVPSNKPIFKRRCLLLGDAALLGKAFSPLHQLATVPAAPDARVVGA